MKQTDENIKEAVVVLEVDNEVINKVRTGEITHIVTPINENSQNLILHNVDGNLLLTVDEMPTTFHGCYLYNNGEFPYAIKDTLNFLLLNGEEDSCLTRIIGVEIQAGMRFNYQGAGGPIVEDPDGDSCVWEVAFEVVPARDDAKTYLMRWNPSISSFTEKDYEACVANAVNGMFRLDWSIFEWQEARRGDLFHMMRTGDDKAGLVFGGQFISDPYPGDDWAGTNRRRMYVDMVCNGFVEPGDTPRITLESLQTAIPEIDWSKGHSGELLSGDVVTKLVELLDEESEENSKQ